MVIRLLSVLHPFFNTVQQNGSSIWGYSDEEPLFTDTFNAPPLKKVLSNLVLIHSESFRIVLVSNHDGPGVGALGH